MKIPFIRTAAEDKAIDARFQEMVRDIIASRDFQNGAAVRSLEELLKEEFKVPFAAGVSSGSSALRIALYALDLKPGARVAVTSFSFYSTATMLLQLGLVPVFVDIDEYYQMRVDQLQELIVAGQVDALLVAHMHGQLLDLSELHLLAKERGIPILEDAAQGFSARRYEHKACTFSDIACLSFSPTKVIGAYGNGGAVLTSNEHLYKRVTSLRWHGIGPQGIDKLGGSNSVLDSIQAAAIQLKIPHAEESLARRTAIADQFHRYLHNTSYVDLPQYAPGSRHSYHKFVVQVSDRSEILAEMLKMGIECKVHYPQALPDNPIFSAYKSVSPFGYPAAKQAASCVMSLPMYSDLREEEAQYICKSLVESIHKINERRLVK